MKRKRLLLGLLMILSLALVAGCAASAPGASPTPAATQAPTATPTPTPEPAASPTPEPATAANADAWLVLTLEELKAYNGQNGMPAYVAVDGRIYDVSGSALWRGGAHNGFTAGRDLTAEIKSISPHGVKVLERVPMVGEIKE